VLAAESNFLLGAFGAAGFVAVFWVFLFVEVAQRPLLALAMTEVVKKDNNRKWKFIYSNKQIQNWCHTILS
jgi:hypothetical protein